MGYVEGNEEFDLVPESPLKQTNTPDFDEFNV